MIANALNPEVIRWKSEVDVSLFAAVVNEQCVVRIRVNCEFDFTKIPLIVKCKIVQERM